MTSSQGVGPGGHGSGTTPLQRDVETSAFVEGNKRSLAMVREDTFEINVFTQLTDDGKYKYTATPGKPTLHPLLHLRISREPIPVEDERLMEIYDKILDTLPGIIRKKLYLELDKPFAERDPSYVALNNLIVLVAKGMVQLEIVSRPMEPNSAAETFYKLNLALPYIAMRAVIFHGQNILTEAEQFLTSVGHEHLQFDILSNYVKELKASYEELKAIQEAILNGAGEEEIQAKMNELNSKISALYERFYRTSVGNEMQILGPLINSMATACSCFSLGFSSPSLLLGFSVATIGLNGSESNTGILGSAWETLIDALVNGFAEMHLSGIHNVGNQKIFENLTKTLFLGIATLSFLVVEEGIGNSPVKDPKEKERLHSFSFEIALRFVLGSTLIKDLSQAIARTAATDNKTERLISEILEFTAIFTAILAASRENPEKALSFFNEFRTKLSDGINRIEEYLSESLANGTFEGKKADMLALFLQQAKMALNKDDLSSLFAAYEGIIGHFGISHEDMIKDLEEIKQFGLNIANAAMQTQAEKTTRTTGIQQAM